MPAVVAEENRIVPYQVVMEAILQVLTETPQDAPRFPQVVEVARKLQVAWVAPAWLRALVLPDHQASEAQAALPAAQEGVVVTSAAAEAAAVLLVEDPAIQHLQV